MSKFIIPTRGELEAAADVLEQLSAIYDMEPELCEWSAADIRNEMSSVENLSKQEVLWTRLAERVGDYLLTGLDIDEAVMKVFGERQFTLTEEPF